MPYRAGRRIISSSATARGQYQVAYGVAPLLRRGITGSGETVVDARTRQQPGAHLTDIRKDLAAFDSKFGLPTAKLHGRQHLRGVQRRPTWRAPRKSRTPRWCTRSRPAPPSTSSWCPANATASAAHFTAAVDQVDPRRHHPARSGGLDQRQPRRALLHPRRGGPDPRGAGAGPPTSHVTVVASSGDTGAISDDGPPVQVSLPASDPLVLGGRRHHPGRQYLRPAPTRARWPGTPTPKPPPAATAACSPGRPTRTASPASAGRAASPTSPPTPTPPPPWR